MDTTPPLQPTAPAPDDPAYPRRDTQAACPVCACCSARLEYATQTHCMSCDAYGCALGAPQCGQEEYGS